jgi:predicted HTH domain antitoxin
MAITEVGKKGSRLAGRVGVI